VPVEEGPLNAREDSYVKTVNSVLENRKSGVTRLRNVSLLSSGFEAFEVYDSHAPLNIYFRLWRHQSGELVYRVSSHYSS